MNKQLTKRIWIEEASIHYQTGVVGWSLPIDSVEIFGEYTDPNGPYVDDYFFVFVTRPEHLWRQASFYADERDKFLTAFGEIREARMTCGLTSSTDYDSRVIWPPELEGTKLFEFVPVKSNGTWKRLKQSLVPEYHFAFTDPVRDYLVALENKSVEELVGTSHTKR